MKSNFSSQFLWVSIILKSVKNNKFISKSGKFYHPPLSPPPPKPTPLPFEQPPPPFEPEPPRLKPIDTEPPWLFLLKTSFKMKKIPQI